MQVVIDRAGRLVIPKAIRDRLGIRGGESLEVVELDGEVRLSRPKGGVELIESEHGILTTRDGGELPGLDAAEVRDLLERTRR